MQTSLQAAFQIKGKILHFEKQNSRDSREGISHAGINTNDVKGKRNARDVVRYDVGEREKNEEGGERRERRERGRENIHKSV